jgi:hypothetical protein
MSDNNYTETISLEPAVEVLKFSQIAEGDVLVLRCEPGTENEAIKNIYSSLKSLIFEKNLKILAIKPNENLENLSLIIRSVNQIDDQVNEELMINQNLENV